MDNEVIGKALEEINTHCSVLQFQVLNNLDALLSENTGKVDMPTLDRLVKGPMMRSLTRIKNARLTLIKLINHVG